MKIKEFFRKSDIPVAEETLTFYLFYKLSQLLPSTYTDERGETHAVDLITDDNWKYLEVQYFHNYSPTKETSVLLDEIYETGSFPTSDLVYQQAISKLANIIVTMYGDNWIRLWYALWLKYNPIDNYNGTEERTVSPDYKQVTTYGATHGTSEGKTKTGRVQTDTGNSVHGFNSSQGVSTTGTNTTVTHLDGDASGYQDKQSGEYDNDEHTDTQTREGSEIVTKHGNLGVTTTQQMLEAERMFRENFNLYKTIFNNIDDVLTCHIYSGGIA